MIYSDRIGNEISGEAWSILQAQPGYPDIFAAEVHGWRIELRWNGAGEQQYIVSVGDIRGTFRQLFSLHESEQSAIDSFHRIVRRYRNRVSYQLVDRAVDIYIRFGRRHLEMRWEELRDLVVRMEPEVILHIPIEQALLLIQRARIEFAAIDVGSPRTLADGAL